VRSLTVSAVMAGLFLSAVSCAPPVRPAAPRADDPAQPCADAQARLAETGLCPDRAIGLLDRAKVAALSGRRPDGCAWVVSDTSFKAPDSRGPRRLALIYMALSCNGQTTRLAVADGVHSSVITYDRAALQLDTTIGEQTAQVFHVPEGEDAKAFIQGLARDTTLNADEAAACTIRSAGIDYYPADALVVDTPEAYRAAQGPDAAAMGFCGDYGVAAGSMAYWRIADGFAWRFNFGQKYPQYDPASMRLLAQDADGAWTSMTPP
jgi:hypothetical protein